MPQKRRRQKERILWHRRLDLTQLMDLDIGWSPATTEFGRARDAAYGFLTLHGVKEAWEAHKGHDYFHEHILNPERPHDFDPGHRPWAWWKFDAPEQPREGESEVDALDRLGLLSDDERKALQRKGDLPYQAPIEEE